MGCFSEKHQIFTVISNLFQAINGMRGRHDETKLQRIKDISTTVGITVFFTFISVVPDLTSLLVSKHLTLNHTILWSLYSAESKIRKTLFAESDYQTLIVANAKKETISRFFQSRTNFPALFADSPSLAAPVSCNSCHNKTVSWNRSKKIML